MITFVGAGPGAADLITLRGADRLAHADIVVWASSLVPEALLTHVRAGAEIHDSKTMTLEDVLAVYAGHPDASIVRLHSGDPSLYGAIGEQIAWCRDNGRAFEIVPGVTSISAAAALIGAELTLPGLAQSLIVTRLAGRTATSMPAAETLSGLASAGATMAILLSAARPEELQASLLAPPSAYTPETPAAIVIRATWPDERVVRTTVGSVAAALKASGATMTTLVLVGPVLDASPGVAEDAGRSRLYSPEFAHHYRRRSTPGTTSGRPARIER